MRAHSWAQADIKKSYHCSPECLREHWAFHKDFHVNSRLNGAPRCAALCRAVLCCAALCHAVCAAPRALHVLWWMQGQWAARHVAGAAVSAGGSGSEER